MIVGFTGTRQGMSASQRKQLQWVLTEAFPVARVIHGGAVGADREAHVIADDAEIATTVHPAGRDPLARNRRIVAECDLLIAAPRENLEEQRSGTWATIRYARQAGKPVVMLSR
jgi:predicted Rossmann fold nucleotide-binding protein DprA/Smf involved in DNA uptake